MKCLAEFSGRIFRGEPRVIARFPDGRWGHTFLYDDHYLGGGRRGTAEDRAADCFGARHGMPVPFWRCLERAADQLTIAYNNTTHLGIRRLGDSRGNRKERRGTK